MNNYNGYDNNGNYGNNKGSEEEKDLLEEEEFKEIIIWDIIMLEKEMKIIKNLRI